MLTASLIIRAPVAEVLQRALFHNSLQAWLAAALTAAILFVVFVITRRIVVSHLEGLAGRTPGHVDDIIVAMLAETRTWVCLAIAILIACAMGVVTYYYHLHENDEGTDNANGVALERTHTAVRRGT